MRRNKGGFIFGDLFIKFLKRFIVFIIDLCNKKIISYLFFMYSNYLFFRNKIGYMSNLKIFFSKQTYYKNLYNYFCLFIFFKNILLSCIYNITFLISFFKSNSNFFRFTHDLQNISKIFSSKYRKIFSYKLYVYNRKNLNINVNKKYIYFSLLKVNNYKIYLIKKKIFKIKGIVSITLSNFYLYTKKKKIIIFDIVLLQRILNLKKKKIKISLFYFFFKFNFVSKVFVKITKTISLIFSFKKILQLFSQLF